MDQVHKVYSLAEYGQATGKGNKPDIIFFYDSKNHQQTMFLKTDLTLVAFEVGDGASVTAVDVDADPKFLASLLDPALHDLTRFPIIRLSYRGLATDHLRIDSRNRLIEAITDRQHHHHPHHHPDQATSA